jgi:hypothetical protein
MTRIDLLKKNYLRICGLPWDRNISGAQRVWVAVYDKEDEQKLRLGLGLFEEATQQAGHHWHALNLTDAFANWMCSPQNASYAESYFEAPELLDDAVLADFKQTVVAQIQAALHSLHQDSVLALYGVGSLFGFSRISEILPMVDSHIRGRLLVFFPGVYEQDNYRLLDARDGWNYQAVPITPSEAEVRR